MRSSRRLENVLLAAVAGLAAGIGLVPRIAAAQSYTLSTQSGSLTSISGIGTPLGVAGQDDYAASFSAPASFPFFGTTVSSGTLLYASTNGLLAIGTSSTEYQNGTIPSSAAPNRFLAPFWDDLNAVATSEIYWATQGAELVVEWSAIESLNAAGESVTFQARIDTGTGVIRFVYGTRLGGSTWNGTIGLEDATGATGTPMSCGSVCTLGDVPQGTVVVFTPSTMPPVGPDLVISSAGALPSTVVAGDSLPVSFVLANQGGLPTLGSPDVELYISPTQPVTASDVYVGGTTLGAVGAGATMSGNVVGSIPSNYSGTYYLALIANPSGAVLELDASNNTRALGSLTVLPPGGNVIQITTTALPNGTVAVPYDQQLTQTGGTSPTWMLDGGALPPGLSLSATGRITGVPTGATTATFTVAAYEEGLEPGSRTLSIVVEEQASAIRLVSPSLPQATVGAPYQAMFEATGGVAPYAFQIIVGRPDWLTADAGGALGGTPDAPGTHALTVSIFDSTNDNVTVQATLEVVAGGPLALASSIPTGVVGRPYSARVVSGGTPPYTIGQTSGTLPSGFAIDGLGVLGGQAAEAGTFTVGLDVTDSATPPNQVSGAITLTLGELMPLSITTRTLSVTINTDEQKPLEARGGVPPYTWSIVTGTLLPGFTLNAAEGKIVGRTEMVATTTVTFAVTDADGSTATQEVIVKSQLFVTQSGADRRGGSGCGCSAERPGGGADLAALFLLAGLWFARRSRRSAAYCRKVAWPSRTSRVERRSSARSDRRRPPRRSWSD